MMRKIFFFLRNLMTHFMILPHTVYLLIFKDIHYFANYYATEAC